MSRAPAMINVSQVPMAVYLEDRREIKGALAEIQGDLKAMRRELDRRDGREAAETAVVAVRRDRRKLLRDVALCVLSAALAIAGTLVTAVVL